MRGQFAQITPLQSDWNPADVAQKGICRVSLWDKMAVWKGITRGICCICTNACCKISLFSTKIEMKKFDKTIAFSA
jgi:hypothetical protein